MDGPARPTRPHGIVAVAVGGDGLSGAMVQLSCAASQAARAVPVLEFADLLAEQVRVRDPRDLEELARQDWIAGGPSAGWALRRCADEVGADRPGGGGSGDDLSDPLVAAARCDRR